MHPIILLASCIIGAYADYPLPATEYGAPLKVQEVYGVPELKTIAPAAPVVTKYEFKIPAQSHHKLTPYAAYAPEVKEIHKPAEIYGAPEYKLIRKPTEYHYSIPEVKYIHKPTEVYGIPEYKEYIKPEVYEYKHQLYNAPIERIHSSPITTKYEYKLSSPQNNYKVPSYVKELPTFEKYYSTPVVKEIPTYQSFYNTPTVKEHNHNIYNTHLVKELPKHHDIYSTLVLKEQPKYQDIYSTPNYQDIYSTPKYQDIYKTSLTKEVPTFQKYSGTNYQFPKVQPQLDEFGRPEIWGPEIPIVNTYNYNIPQTQAPRYSNSYGLPQ